MLPRQDPIVHSSHGNQPSEYRDLLERFADDGYLAMPDLFSVDETRALLAEAEKLKRRAEHERPEEAFFESHCGAVRSVFAVHRVSELFAHTCQDARLLGIVNAILGDDVYVHQSRLNYKPAFQGREFYWHSDFETWHAEDGMPRMRAVSLSLSLTQSFDTNGPLMLIPGSHKTFVSCAGETPPDHYRESLVNQRVGTPDDRALKRLVRDSGGIETIVGPPGSAVLFDCNAMHGSNGNITPYARTNLFVVYNAVSNRLQAPFAAEHPRPDFVAARTPTPVSRPA